MSKLFKTISTTTSQSLELHCKNHLKRTEMREQLWEARFNRRLLKEKLKTAKLEKLLKEENPDIDFSKAFQ